MMGIPYMQGSGVCVNDTRHETARKDAKAFQHRGEPQGYGSC